MPGATSRTRSVSRTRSIVALDAGGIEDTSKTRSARRRFAPESAPAKIWAEAPLLLFGDDATNVSSAVGAIGAQSIGEPGTPPTRMGLSIIDTPGLREFHLWLADVGLDDTFPDLAEIASRCRFRDCRQTRHRVQG